MDRHEHFYFLFRWCMAQQQPRLNKRQGWTQRQRERGRQRGRIGKIIKRWGGAVKEKTEGDREREI